MVKNLPAGDAGDSGLILRLGRSPEEKMATHSSILAWESHGQRSLVGYSLWGHKKYTTEHTRTMIYALLLGTRGQSLTNLTLQKIREVTAKVSEKNSDTNLGPEVETVTITWGRTPGHCPLKSTLNHPKSLFQSVIKPYNLSAFNPGHQGFPASLGTFHCYCQIESPLRFS